MKILVINPPNVPFTSKTILIEPIDALEVATFLKTNGFEVSFLDMDVTQMKPSKLEVGDNDVVLVIHDYHIPLHNNSSLAPLIEINKQIKNNNDKTVTILAGKLATYGSDEKLQQYGYDHYIRYEIENSIISLLNNVLKNRNFKDSIIKTKDVSRISAEVSQAQYLSIPIADRSLVDISQYEVDVRTILSSRGCNLKCNFCHVPGFWGKWKYKHENQVVEEILYLQNTYPGKADKILFLDDNATAVPHRMRKISDELVLNGSKSKLGCLSTILSFDEATFEKMYAAGFRWVHFGVESGSNETLAKIGKKTTIQNVKDVLKKVKSIGFRVRTSWILDAPDQDEYAMRQTEDAIMEIASDEIRLHYVSIRPGSILADSIEYGQNWQPYIHSNHQNINLTKVTSAHFDKMVKRLFHHFEQFGYVCADNTAVFENMPFDKNSKIIATCPIRYGIDW